MRYYRHHIGDFDKATRHLSRIERSVYLDLIHIYYDTEKPLSLDGQSLARLIIARSPEELAAVEQVLKEFFLQTAEGWFHSRCEEEIAAYRENASKAAQAGKASAEAKQLRKQQALNERSTDVQRTFNGCSTDVERTFNMASTERQLNVNQPITNNQEPTTNNQEPIKDSPPAPKGENAQRKRSAIALAFSRPDSVPETAWADWLAVRKAKKAGPVTQTAMDGLSREATQAGLPLADAVAMCAERGWVSLRADWISKPAQQATRRASEPVEPEWRRHQREQNEALLGPFSARAGRERRERGESILSIGGFDFENDDPDVLG